MTVRNGAYCAELARLGELLEGFDRALTTIVQAELKSADLSGHTKIAAIIQESIRGSISEGIWEGRKRDITSGRLFEQYGPKERVLAA